MSIESDWKPLKDFFEVTDYLKLWRERTKGGDKLDIVRSSQAMPESILCKLRLYLEHHGKPHTDYPIYVHPGNANENIFKGGVFIYDTFCKIYLANKTAKPLRWYFCKEISHIILRVGNGVFDEPIQIDIQNILESVRRQATDSTSEVEKQKSQYHQDELLAMEYANELLLPGKFKNDVIEKDEIDHLLPQEIADFYSVPVQVIERIVKPENDIIHKYLYF